MGCKRVFDCTDTGLVDCDQCGSMVLGRLGGAKMNTEHEPGMEPTPSDYAMWHAQASTLRRLISDLRGGAAGSITLIGLLGMSPSGLVKAAEILEQSMEQQEAP